MKRDGGAPAPDQLERDLAAILGVGAPRRAPPGPPPVAQAARARVGTKALVAGALALVASAAAVVVLMRLPGSPATPDRPPIETAAMPVARTPLAPSPAPIAGETSGAPAAAPAPSVTDARPAFATRSPRRTVTRARRDPVGEPTEAAARPAAIDVATRDSPPSDPPRAGGTVPAAAAPEAAAPTVGNRVALASSLSPREERAASTRDDPGSAADPRGATLRKLQGIDAIRLLRRQ